MTPARLQQQLATLYSNDPRAMRTQLLETLLAAVPAEGAAFVSAARSADGALHCTFPVNLGPDAALVDHMGYHCSVAVVDDAPWLPHLAPPGTLNHFVRFTSGVDSHGIDIGRLKVYEVVFAALEVNAHLRAVFLDGPAFLGYVALMRRGRDAHFTAAEQRLLENSFKSIGAVLGAARALQRLDLDRDAVAVLRPDGGLEYASTAMARWLDDRPLRRAAVTAYVRQCDVNPQAPSLVVEGVELRTVRLDGPAVRYLVSGELARPVHYPAASTLTARQRQLAEYAAAGATMREVSAAMDITEHTAKSHLKQIYMRLGVSSRVELVEALRALNP